jgi:phosphatidylglycerol:prolipoprotein diacylglycerol transferase
MTMGQWLCVPMVAAGIALWVWAQRQPVAVPK